MVTNDIRDQPGVKHRRFLWHVSIPIHAYGDMEDADVLAQLLAADLYVAGMVIHGDICRSAQVAGHKVKVAKPSLLTLEGIEGGWLGPLGDTYDEDDHGTT